MTTKPEEFSNFSKEHRWYYNSLDDHIDESSYKLLQKYSHIPAEDVNSHIYKLRDILWSQAPYPCVGEFKFLTLNLPKHPRYDHILSLLQPTSSFTSSSQPQLLDIGCCVAQELRSLTFAGIPSSQLYGSDLNSSYLTTSYDLFKDKDTFQGTLVPADIFSPALFSSPFKGWEHKFSVIHAGLLLHLFTWQQQLQVCDAIVALLKDKKGGVFLGEMVGCKGGRVKGGLGKRKMWLHDEGSFGKLWGEVEEKTGTRGEWNVESKLKSGDGVKEERGFFTGEGVGWLTFSVERI